MKYELTCINCPMGCRITADYDGKEVRLPFLKYSK